MEKDEVYSRAREVLDTEPFVVLATIGRGGYPENRTVFNLRAMARLPEGRLAPPFSGLEEGWLTYLGTNASSRKTAQLLADPRLSLCFAKVGASLRGLSIQGRAVPVEDAVVKRALWREGWECYYPRGPLDPDFAVFRVEPLSVRYYEGLQVTELLSGEGDRGEG